MPSLLPSRADARSLESEIATVGVQPPIAEAREALAYWRDRASRLPWYRWEARREARTMASRWRERLLRARLERWGLQTFAPALVPLARGRADLGRLVARRMVRPAGLGRRVALFAGAVLLGTVAAMTLFVVLVVHLAGQVV